MSSDTAAEVPPNREVDPSVPSTEQDVHGEELERLVYFFLPLVEPLQLPDDHRVETLDAMSFAELRRAHLEGEGHPDGWDGEYLVASSRIWQTTIPRSSYLPSMLHAPREVAHKAIPTLNHLAVTEQDAAAEDVEAIPKTVVEVAVRVGEFGEQVARAFEVAVDCVQSIQRAHYLVNRRPLTLLTVENAPFIVLMAQREARPSDGPHGGWPDSFELYMPNTNLQSVTLEPEWDEETVREFGDALAIRNVATFVPMAQLMEDGRHALHRRGDYRSAVTLLYSASEVMFDTLLMLMLWEENKTPEQAASECFAEGGLQTRLKAHYAKRMRGSWHFDRPGPLAHWNRDLAAIRHRVVHAGYIPAREEAHQADATFDTLHEFITERMTIGTFIRTYPVTALSFMGIGEMKARGRWTKWLDRLSTDPTEIEWPTTFARWKMWLDRLRTDEEPVEVEDGDCVPVLLLEVDNEDTWWLHDTLNRRVVQTGVPPDFNESAQDLIAEQRAEFEAHAQPGDRGSLAWAGKAGEPLPTETWLPEHEVLPLHGIMRDGSDERTPRRPS